MFDFIIKDLKTRSRIVKKILTALALILLLGVNCLFSACSLVTINNDKYLAQVVAKTDGVQITMKDLIQGYNSFGYDYVQSNNMTTEEAVKRTMEDLIDRELLVIKAKEEFGELSIAQKNEVYTETFKAINSNIKEFADEIIEKEELSLPISNEETEETATSFAPYTKTVERIKNADGTYTYKRIVEEEVVEDKLIEFALEEYGIEGLADRAYSKYITSLKKNNTEYKNLSNDQILEKEIERIYEIYEKNKYMTLFQEDFENNASINLEAIKDKYIELVKSSAFTYGVNEDSYNSKMQSTSGEVYYQPFGDKYIQVAHILIQYSDDQNKEISKLKSDLNAGYIDIDEYDLCVKQIASEITTKALVNGEEVGNEKSVNEVYNEIKDAINACGNDDDLKIKTFIKYIEMYNDDDGMMTALNSQTQYYAVNLDTSVTDNMVKEFADASRALYSSDGSTDYTLYATPVLSQYGYHIIFSMGTIRNDISLNNIDNVTISYLWETEAMKGTNKSLFDKILELVDNSEYAKYQSSVVADMRAGKTIKYNKTAYERLYK